MYWYYERRHFSRVYKVNPKGHWQVYNDNGVKKSKTLLQNNVGSTIRHRHLYELCVIPGRDTDSEQLLNRLICNL